MAYARRLAKAADTRDTCLGGTQQRANQIARSDISSGGSTRYFMPPPIVPQAGKVPAVQANTRTISSLSLRSIGPIANLRRGNPVPRTENMDTAGAIPRLLDGRS